MPPRTTATEPATDADWRGLYHRAQGLHQLAPWRWMNDGQVFGVRDRQSREIAWCAVLGNAGEFDGLAIYLGDGGFDQYRRLGNGTIGDDLELGHYGYLVCFGDRSDLKPVELARIRASGLRFRGRGVWPQVDRKRAGYDFQPVDPAEVPLLLDLLHQTLLVAIDVQAVAKRVAPDSEGHLLVRECGRGTWHDTRVAPPQPPEPELCPLDHERVAALRRMPLRLAERFEYDVFPFLKGSIRDEDGGAYLPAVFMLVDSKTGMVLHTGLERPELRQRAAAAQLLSAFETNRVVPRKLAVRRPELAYGLHPTLDALGVEIEVANWLPELSQARQALGGM